MFVTAPIQFFPYLHVSMRSMTHASADTPVAIPLVLPTIPTPVPPGPADLSYTSPHTPQATPTSPHSRPLPSSVNQHSFFTVNDPTNLLSPHSRRHVARAIQNGWAGSTVKRYSGAIDQFIRFCDSESVPDHLRFPADEFVLCAFAASSAGIHARTTPRNHR